MLTRFITAFTFGSILLVAQDPGDRRFDPGDFQRVVDAGWPPGPERSKAAYFAVSNDEMAIPILVKALKPKLTGKEPSEFVWAALNWITYKLNERSVAAVAELCSANRADCRWMVETLLDHAAALDREYEIAYETAEKHPRLLEYVVPWISKTIGSFAAERVFAREVLKREKAGLPTGQKDPLLSRLPISARERISQVVEEARKDQVGRPYR